MAEQKGGLVLLSELSEVASDTKKLVARQTDAAS